MLNGYQLGLIFSYKLLGTNYLTRVVLFEPSLTTTGTCLAKENVFSLIMIQKRVSGVQKALVCILFFNIDDATFVFLVPCFPRLEHKGDQEKDRGKIYLNLLLNIKKAQII